MDGRTASRRLGGLVDFMIIRRGYHSQHDAVCLGGEVVSLDINPPIIRLHLVQKKTAP